MLTADGPAGVLRGLATLRQSITNVPGGFAIPAMVIDDAPRFVWRGVMIDIARHFISPPTLKRQIDATQRVKLNVLHLHLSDNQGFRVKADSIRGCTNVRRRNSILKRRCSDFCRMRRTVGYGSFLNLMFRGIRERS